MQIPLLQPLTPIAPAGSGAASAGDSIAGAFAGLLDQMLALLIAPPDGSAPVDAPVVTASAGEGDVAAGETSAEPAVDAAEVAVAGAVPTSVPVDAKAVTTVPAGGAVEDAEAPQGGVAAPTVSGDGEDAAAGTSRGARADSPRANAVARQPEAVTPAVAGEAQAVSADEVVESEATVAAERGPRTLRAIVNDGAVRDAQVDARTLVPPPPLARGGETRAPAEVQSAENATPVRVDAADANAATADAGDDGPSSNLRQEFAARVQTSADGASRIVPHESFDVVRAAVHSAEPVRVPSEPPAVQGASGIEAPRDVPVRALDVASNVTRAAPEPQAVAESAIRSVRHLVGRGEETITVRLVPESLGEMHVTVRRSGGGLELHLSSMNHAVRDVLEGQLPAMREALARDGIEVTRAGVGHTPLSDTSAGTASQSNHSQNQHAAAREASHGHARNYGGEPAGRFGAANAAAQFRPSTHDGTLNVLI